MKQQDARFIQPQADHDDTQWAEYFAADLASLPGGEVPLVVFFGGHTWQHPDPAERGEQPYVREDGTIGYTHRFPSDTEAARQAVIDSGRKPLIYVNPLRWKRLYDEWVEGEPALSLLAFCMELRAAGWHGIYFDGTPPTGIIETEQDDKECADWLIELKRAWPGVYIYLHASGRLSPGLTERHADAVLFGEWGDGWIDPTEAKVLSYARELLLMGTEAVYKPATHNSDDHRPSMTEWFDTFAALGAVRAAPAWALQFDRAIKIRS